MLLLVNNYCSLSCDSVSVQIQSRAYRAMVFSHVKMIEVDILCDDACSSDTVRRDVIGLLAAASHKTQ